VPRYRYDCIECRALTGQRKNATLKGSDNLSGNQCKPFTHRQGKRASETSTQATFPSRDMFPRVIFVTGHIILCIIYTEYIPVLTVSTCGADCQVVNDHNAVSVHYYNGMHRSLAGHYMQPTCKLKPRNPTGRQHPTYSGRNQS